MIDDCGILIVVDDDDFLFFYSEFESNITQDGAWHSLCVGWLLLHKMVDVYYDGLTAGTAPPVGMVSS